MVLRHLCPAGCCGLEPCADRAKSVSRAVDLVMAVICPHMTKPAANRFTKVAPVVGSVCLKLNFFTVFKKAMRRLLANRSDNSDDEAVLHDVNAVVGAPVDAIRFYRRLQDSAYCRIAP